MAETRTHGRGTSMTVSYPWGLFLRCRAICPDGKVRSVRVAQTADTFFSIPASVLFKGKRVAGYVTFSDDYGSEPAWVEFRVVDGRKNSHLFTVASQTLLEEDADE